MIMTDLVAFLTACLDEDAAIAHAASAFYDDADENGVSWNGHEGESQNGSMYFWPAPHLGVIYDVASGRHINRHDPARVLAEVAAKRKLLEPCAAAVTGPDVLLRPGQATFLAVQAMHTMAAAYADRPDYDARWRP